MKRPRSFVLKYLLLPCILGGIVPLTAQSDSDPEATQLLTAVSQRMVGFDLTSLVSLTEMEGEDTVRHQEFRFWVHYPERGDSIFKQTLVEIFYPPKAAGQKFWSWQMVSSRQRSWIYLPGSGKLREVSSRSRRQSEEYDFSELAISPREIAAHTNLISGREKLEDREVIVIKSTAHVDSLRSSGRRSREQTYKLLWVDPRAKLVRKAEFFTPNGRLLRRIIVEETEIHEGLELVTLVQIWDPRKKRRIHIAVTDISLDPIREEELFQPSGD